ncbi:DUF3794 and LysM peptidoglycan-binding domain-containing protein [Desulfotomaculum copahuensis]|uniref:Peptidoglycan-binding protein n=1 Tax=Desulfotomaculum copahuensis TaxID=1838280 RepID=A0A1B7LFN6_9FIRM|nr:SPOCS domain-containing protein [Desulfotomaculum copahuensis]OAT82955.1 peptidoglycan-binding protein [Desulfotomaculum copahuensis]
MSGYAVPATEKLRVNQVVNENTNQVVVRGTVSVPDPKPAAEKILSIDKTAKINKIELVPNKAIIEGTLTVQIVYVALEPAQSVHSMHAQLPFTTFVDLPGVEPGMDTRGKVTVEDISVTLHHGDPCKLDVSAVLSVFVKVTEMRDIDVITQCPAGATCETEQLTVSNVVASKTKQIIVSEDFDTPEEKPAIEKILDVFYSAEITNTRLIKNKVIVDGTITLQVLYVAALPDQPVHQLHRTIHFSDFVELPGATPDMDVRVDVVVENVDVEPLQGVCCTRLRADVVLKLIAFASEPREITVLTKVSGAQATMAKLRIDHVVGEDAVQVVLRDVFETPEPKPAVEKILSTSVENVHISETKIISDKVIIRGYVDVQVVYVAAVESQAVHAMHRRVHFRTFVEVKGAQSGMDVEVRPFVEFITATAEGCEIALELVLKVAVKVIQTLQRKVVISITATPAPSPSPSVCPPGQTISYTVQAGDTFWSIAQKYGTSVNAIINANPGKSPENLQPGDVINVPCVAKG